MARFDLDLVPEHCRELFGDLNVLMARFTELMEAADESQGDNDPNYWPAIRVLVDRMKEINEEIAKRIGCDFGGGL